jgi:hypothetical protein
MAENKKSSPIWDFFTSDVDNASIAICNLCKTKLTRGTNPKNFSTSPMIQHLRAKHIPVFKTYQKACVEKAEVKEKKQVLHTSRLTDSSTASSSMSQCQISLEQSLERVKKWDIKSAEAMRIHRAIGLMIIKDMEPFQVVEKEGTILLVIT